MTVNKIRDNTLSSEQTLAASVAAEIVSSRRSSALLDWRRCISGAEPVFSGVQYILAGAIGRRPVAIGCRSGLCGEPERAILSIVGRYWSWSIVPLRSAGGR